MNRPTPAQIDAIVRAVLDELARRSGSSKPPRGNVFAERLLAERHVESLALGTQELEIAPGTVVTPLARDLLKHKGISLRFASRKEETSSTEAGEWGFAIEQTNEIGKPASVRRQLLSDPTGWSEVGRTAREAALWTSRSSDRGVVLLTEEASVAVWSAHRLEEIRAATVQDLAAVDRAARQLGMNMLVIESGDKSIHLIKQMCFAFRSRGAPRKPSGLETSTERSRPMVDGGSHADRGSRRTSDFVAQAHESTERAPGDRLALNDGGDRRGIFAKR